jgi:putative transposase
VTYSWVRPGERKLIPYENPQGRRLNALAAMDKTGPEPGLYWVAKPNKALKAEEFLRFLDALPRLPVLRVVVLDNGSIHHNDLVKAALPDLWTKGIYLYYLPPYSPELNEIEPLFQDVKHHDLPERTYTSVPALTSAVHDAFTRAETRILAKCELKPRLAA